jgi:hypothetical protein
MGHVSILTTARYTHLTDTNDHQSYQKINSLMGGFQITWGKVLSSNPGKPYGKVLSSNPGKQVGGAK